MRSLILYLRGLVFGLFIVCNAIICSVAVWHLGLAQTVSYNPPVDIYLIFLGAFGLLFIFAIIWVDIIRKNAVTSHVWFECLWVGLFWVLDLAATAALSASAPTVMCSPDVKLVVPQACTATRVLLGFTWLSMIITLVYVVALTILAVVHQKQSTDVWHTGVRVFCWFGAHEHLDSRAGTPVRGTGPGAMVAPQPRPAGLLPISARFARSPIDGSEKDPESAISSVSHVAQLPHVQRQSTQPLVASLYPQQVVKNLPPAALPQPAPKASATRSTSPPPLGEWPRADILSRPRDTGRKRSQQSVTTQPPAPVPTSPLPQRPRGSRSRSSSGEIRRPPPLDLTNISFFRNIDERIQNRA